MPASPLAGFAPWLGAYGVSLAVAGAAALAVALTQSFAWSRTRIALAGALAALFLAGGVARKVEWTEPAGAPSHVALLQGNVPQELKWRDDVRAQTLADYRQMIFDAPAKIVVLPETALPAFLDQLPADYLESLREHARQAGKEILMGTVEREYRGKEFDYYNSVVRLTGGAVQSYRKRHLVPFGEFIPPGFKWVLAILKIPLSDFASGADQQPPLEAGGTKFGVAICYEDLFGEEMIDFLPEAQVLLNVSNDGMVRRIARRGPAPAGLAGARAGDRALDGARDQHRRHRGHRRQGSRRRTAAGVHIGDVAGRGRASIGRDAIRPMGKRAGDPRGPCDLHRGLAPRSPPCSAPVELSL